MKRALILVDLQNDFLPGGALAVPEGDRVVPIANDLMLRFPHVVATQDWHPADHGSFAANHPGKHVFEQITLAGLPQTLWPVHCVQNSGGAAFAPELRVCGINQIIRKGTRADVDSYSGFFDNNQRNDTGLNGHLKSQGINDIFVAGLATDYCVKATALDARRLGYNVTLIQDACRGVNLKPDDVSNALRQMSEAGVQIVDSGDL